MMTHINPMFTNLELDPNSYINYYKRATAYLSLGRHSAALDDFDSILRLNPTFAQVRQILPACELIVKRLISKPKLWTKEGEFDKAQNELKLYGKSKSDGEAIKLGDSVKVALSAITAAQRGAKNRSWAACVDQATKALEVAPNSAEIRELRLECETEMGDVEAVYGDLR